jgi:hypothetical protein
MVTDGGRVLHVVGKGKTLKEARSIAYASIEQIHLKGSAAEQISERNKRRLTCSPMAICAEDAVPAIIKKVCILCLTKELHR